MKFHTSIAAAVLGLGLLGGVASVAQAQESVVVEAVRATTYMNGGIGQDEQARMKRLAPDFSLRMTFSEHKDGEYLADIPVLITDARGNPVFELPNAGPMLNIAMPPGKYRIAARFKGMNEFQDVTITGKESKDLSFHWRGTPKT